MAGGKACQLGSTLRARRTVVRKSEVIINLKSQGEEELQAQQPKKTTSGYESRSARLSDMMWDIYYVNVFLILIDLLTAIGLTLGGSSTVHIYTQTVHRTTQ
jgi:hypothetical protein